MNQIARPYDCGSYSASCWEVSLRSETTLFRAPDARLGYGQLCGDPTSGRDLALRNVDSSVWLGTEEAVHGAQESCRWVWTEPRAPSSHLPREQSWAETHGRVGLGGMTDIS